VGGLSQEIFVSQSTHPKTPLGLENAFLASKIGWYLCQTTCLMGERRLYIFGASCDQYFGKFATLLAAFIHLDEINPEGILCKKGNQG